MEIVIYIYGYEWTKKGVQHYLNRELNESEERDIESIPDSKVIASEIVSNDANPFYFPGWGQIETTSLISTSKIPYNLDRSTRFMIWDEFFGRYSQESGLDQFIDYFNEKYEKLFEEIFESTGAKLIVENSFF